VVTDSRGRPKLWISQFFSFKSGTWCSKNTVRSHGEKKFRTDNNFGFWLQPVDNFAIVQNLSPDLSIDSSSGGRHPERMNSNSLDECALTKRGRRCVCSMFWRTQAPAERQGSFAMRVRVARFQRPSGGPVHAREVTKSALVGSAKFKQLVIPAQAESMGRSLDAATARSMTRGSSFRAQSRNPVSVGGGTMDAATARSMTGGLVIPRVSRGIQSALARAPWMLRLRAA
jgi:hypothetical protein